MEHNHDPELGNLLRQWRVPPHSAALEDRVLGLCFKSRNPPWWRFLLTGSIRVPVPLAFGLAVLLTFGAWRTVRMDTLAPCLSAIAPVTSVACPASTRC